MFNIFKKRDRQNIYDKAKNVAGKVVTAIGAATPGPIGAVSNAYSAYQTAKPLFNSQSSQQNQPQQQPNSSQAKIQASGYGSQYANDLSQQQPKPDNQTPPPLQTQERVPSPTDNFMSNMDQSATNRTNLLNEQQAQNEAYLKALYGNANAGLSGQIPTAENNFNTFKANTMADLVANRASGETQKGNVRDYTGEAQRLAAQTRRETQGQTQRTFANLGTLDSRGEGSFQQATENQDSEFNRFTQQNLKQQVDKLAQVDQLVAKAERDGMAAISQKEGELLSFKQQIEQAQANNNIELVNSLKQGYFNTQSEIYQIKDTIENMKYEQQVKQMELQNELAKLGQDTSPEFQATGQPVTQADYIWRMNNADEYNKLFPNAITGNNGQAEKGQIINLVDNVLATDTNNLTGDLRLGGLYAQGKDKKAQIEQIKNKLSLEARTKLKGQGTISDNEANMLAKAVTSLDYGMTDEAFRRELMNIKAILESQGGVGSNNNSNSSVDLNQFVTG